jgi:hypothetical protein
LSQESTVVNTPVPVLPSKGPVGGIDQTDGCDVVPAPPAVQTIEIDGRDAAIPNANDFLRQTAQASERIQGVCRCLSFTVPRYP